MLTKICQHIRSIKDIKTSKDNVCDECIKTGDAWVHLRTCQICGVTLCCDQSTNQHARKHYNASKHPVINSAEPGERWLYCYTDEEFARY